MFALARAVPADEFAALGSVADLIALIAAEVADRDAIDPGLSRLMFEAMREAERDASLRERISALLTQYRELMTRTVRAEQERSAVFAGAPAGAIAPGACDSPSAGLHYQRLEGAAHGSVDVVEHALREA